MTEDAGEEYFRLLEKMEFFQDSHGRALIANAREDYRQRSRYTQEYWNQREEFLKSQAMKREAEKTRPIGVLRKWISKLWGR